MEYARQFVIKKNLVERTQDDTHTQTNTNNIYLTAMLALRRLPSKEKTHQEPDITATALGESVGRNGRVILSTTGRVAGWATEATQVNTIQRVGDTHIVITTTCGTTNLCSCRHRHDEGDLENLVHSINCP